MLTPKQVHQLRAKAHALNPVVTIAEKGLTNNVHQEIEQALDAHELIKIRVSVKDKEYKSLLAEQICETHQAKLVQIIGGIIVIYRIFKEGDSLNP
jgi:putative YhbY family RNA-binding protein